MRLAMLALASGNGIPALFTCDGKDRSPAMAWSDTPAGVRSFALILDDPDAPGGVFGHWAAYDIAAGVRRFEEGAGNAVRTSFRQARNDFGTPGYRGPCPPRGHGAHHYRFKLFALDVAHLDAGDAPTIAEVERAMAGHVLAAATVTASYGRGA